MVLGSIHLFGTDLYLLITIVLSWDFFLLCACWGDYISESLQLKEWSDVNISLTMTLKWIISWFWKFLNVEPVNYWPMHCHMLVFVATGLFSWHFLCHNAGWSFGLIILMYQEISVAWNAATRLLFLSSATTACTRRCTSVACLCRLSFLGEKFSDISTYLFLIPPFLTFPWQKIQMRVSI